MLNIPPQRFAREGLLRPIPILVAVAVTAACAPSDRAVRLARLAGEKRNLAATLDRLEERLLADQARVRFWREMKERHESVSAIACAVQGEHAAGMALHGLPSEVPSTFGRARVAAVTPGVTKPTIRTDAAP